MPRIHFLSTLVAFALLAGSGPAGAAWDPDPASSLNPVCDAPNEQYWSTVISDGAGGAIAVWHDYRHSNPNIYAQRVLAQGALAWATSGLGVGADPGSQVAPAAISDGAGGIFVAWMDSRDGNSIYAQWIDATGTARWGAGGVAATSPTGESQSWPVIARDGDGGIVVGWLDVTNRRYAAQRLGANGARLWNPAGVSLSAQTMTNWIDGIAGDGAGGAIFLWTVPTTPTGGPVALTAQAVDGNGALRWGPSGLPLLSNTTTAYDCRLCPDGAGGAIAAWRSEEGHLLAQRLDHGGSFLWNAGAPLEVFGGLVSSAAAYPNGPPSSVLVEDGAGGAFLGWKYVGSDGVHVAAQRLSPSGAASWGAGGVTVCTAAGLQKMVALTPDGAGGLGLAWSDGRSGAFDIYAQWLDAAGHPRWQADGVAISRAPDQQVFPHLVPSQQSSWIVTWEDYRNGPRDLYSERVDAYGNLGDPAATSPDVVDAANDQGGVAYVRWGPSYLDRPVNRGVVQYQVQRQIQTARAARPGVDEAGWEPVATVTATSSGRYQTAVSTYGDDVGGVHPLTTYRVVAQSDAVGTGPSWISAPASGWSIDNLAPPRLTGIHGSYDAGTTALGWDVSPAADIGVYRIYRSVDFAFTPSPATYVGETTETQFVDAAGGEYYYRLTAVDVHGNESESAPFAAGTLAVGDDPGAALALALPFPHPIRGAATIRFATARAGSVRLAVIDPAGRRIATLVDGALPAGRHEAAWPGTGLASGLYLLELETAGVRLTRRVVVTR